MAHKEQQVPIQQYIDEIYAGLWSLIKEKSEAAKEAEKPLLVVMGENHKMEKCSLVEMMVMDITYRLGLDVAFTTEMTPTLISTLLDRSSSDFCIENHRLISEMFKTLASLNYDITSAEHPDIDSIKSGDVMRAISGEGLIRREKHMVNTVLDNSRNVVYVGGHMHLEAISGNAKIKVKYEVLSLNTVTLTKANLDGYAANKKVTPPETQEHHLQSFNPGNAIQVIIDRDVVYNAQTLARNASIHFREKISATSTQCDKWIQEQKEALVQRSESLGLESFKKLELATKPTSQILLATLMSGVKRAYRAVI